MHLIYIEALSFYFRIYCIIHYHHHHLTQCILFIENYGQGLGKEGRRQFMPIKESAAKGVSQLEKDKKTYLHGKNKLNAYK